MVEKRYGKKSRKDKGGGRQPEKGEQREAAGGNVICSRSLGPGSTAFSPQPSPLVLAGSAAGPERRSACPLATPQPPRPSSEPRESDPGLGWVRSKLASHLGDFTKRKESLSSDMSGLMPIQVWSTIARPNCYPAHKCVHPHGHLHVPTCPVSTWVQTI